MYNSGVRGKRGADGYGIISSQDQFIQSKLTYPSITGYNACNVNQVILDDAAVTPGGYMLLYGTAFTTGMTLTIGTATVSSYTLVNTGTIFLTVPITLITGTYNVSIFSSTGGGAIFTTLLVSGFPIFTQTTYTVLGTTVVNVQLLVSGDAPLTFSLGSNSTLPPGVSLSGTGLLSGTITPFSGNSQTYTFNVNVDDAQSQTTTQLITLSVTLGDTYWPNNTLLLDSNTPGNVNTFVTDASLNNNILTIFGDTRPNNINPYQAGYYSNYFDGTGDYLTVPSSVNNSPQALPFTLECWVYMTATGAANRGIVLLGTANTATNSCGIYVGPTGTPNWYIWDGSTSTSGGAYTLNAWTHLAYVREGTGASQTKFYVNGVLAATTTVSATFTSPWPIYIGTSITISETLTGYISNVRFVKGTAVYTGAFTVPTSPLQATQSSGTNIAAITTTTSLLTCQSNRLIDNSTNNFTITKNGDTTVQTFNPFGVTTSTTVNTLYSTYFDGTGDYLQIPNNSTLGLPTGNFTLEAWVNPIGLSGTYKPIAVYALNNALSAVDLAYFLYVDTSNFIKFAVYVGATVYIVTSTSTISLSTWTHVAAVRSGNTLTLFVNGTAVPTTATISGTITDSVSCLFRIGGYQEASTFYYWNGHISNVRLVKGVAVYTGTFTPPTSNLTATQSSGTNISAITGTETSLLTCQNSTLIDNSTNLFAITSFGQAQPIALSPFTQSTTSVSLTNLGSTYFDGTGDYLTVQPSPLNLTGNITLECWIYQTAQNSFEMICGDGPNYVAVRSGQINVLIQGQFDYNWTGTVPLNQWVHFALVRQGTTVYVYLNGVSIGTPLTGNSGIWFGTGTFCVGQQGQASFWYYHGYISNFRIVKGTAIYTSNFAPPVQPLTAVTNTSLLTLQTSQPTSNSMFVDNSSLSNLVTRAGNTNQGSFSPYGLNWSQFFPSAGATYVSPGTSTLLALGAGDFTIECWLYLNSLAPSFTTLFDWRTNGLSPSGVPVISDNNNNGTLCFLVGTGSGFTTLLTSSSVMPINSWFHLAVVRSGTALAMYFNGASVATGTSSATFGIQTFNIGNPQATNYGAPMYVTNVRIVKGTAVYTTAFSPPTTPLTPITNTQLLAFQNSGTQIDNSVNNFDVSKITTITSQRFSPFSTTTQIPNSYSTSVNLATISTPAGLATAMGGGFATKQTTIEAWIFPTSFPSADSYLVIFIGAYPAVAANGRWQFGFFGSAGTTGKLVFSYSIGTATDALTQSTGNPINLSQWNHVAVTINATVTASTTINHFVNGILTDTFTGQNFTTQTAFYTSPTIGNSGYSYQYYGNISNLRILKDTLQYTGNYTVPTTPLTSNSNTALLTCQSSSLIDNSSNNFTLTPSNATGIQQAAFNPFGYTTTQGQSYTPALFGGSGYFDGTGDWLTLPHNPVYTPTGDFCIEFWAYTASNNLFEFYAKGNGIQIFTNAGSWTVAFSSNNTTTYYITAASRPIVLNSWQHVATYRIGTAYYQAVNGIRVLLGTSASSPNTGTDLQYIGASQGLYPVPGYMSDVRTVIGSSVYPASNFVPPIAPLTAIAGTVLFVNMTKAGIADYTRSVDLETAGDSRLITESAYNGNYYSNYFDGTGDWLTAPASSVNSLANGPFTVEAWIFITGAQTQTYGHTIAGTYPGSGNGWVLVVNRSTGGNGIFWGNGSPAGQIAVYNTYLDTGKWYHIAVVRTSTAASGLTIYLNGVSVATGTDATNDTVVQTLYVAGGNTVFGGGYITNVRVVKGVAVYTGTFTPPTSPLTATQSSGTNISAITGTDTSLLTCQSNSFKDNSTNNFTITRNGDTLVKSFNPFTLNTPTSMSFDGTGDYVLASSAIANPNFAFGTGDFTIEFWAYLSVTSNGANLYDNRPLTTNGFYQTIYVPTAAPTTIRYLTNSTDVITSAAGVITGGVWQYVVLSRSSTSTRLFVNGTQVGSTYTDTNTYLSGANRPVLAASGFDLSTSLNGYIEDLRITKGVARYAGNFTVPTNKLPTF